LNPHYPKLLNASSFWTLRGVKKIAWVWPGAAPGNEPAGGKDKIENRYFSTEAQALAWVAS
jgi:hypothetical protein